MSGPAIGAREECVRIRATRRGTPSQIRRSLLGREGYEGAAVTLLNYVLGDRAGAYVLGSSLLVITLATIAAIVDLPLRTLSEARFAPPPRLGPPLPSWLFVCIGLPASLLVFISAAVQAYLASTPSRASGDGLVLYFTINAAFFLAVLIWGLASPLSRHWGLGLGAFGLGLAVLFPLLAVILSLDFGAFGTLTNATERILFAAAVGAILCSLGSCVAAILSMLVYVASGSMQLIIQHRLHAPSDAGIRSALTPLAVDAPDGAASRRRGPSRARRQLREPTAAKKANR